MATYGWEDCDVFLISGFDFIDYLTEEVVLPEQKAILDVIRPLGSIWPRVFDSGQRDTMRSLTHTNLYNDESGLLLGGPDQALVGLPEDGEFILAFEGNTIGTRVACGAIQAATYDRVPGVDKLTRIKGEHVIDGGYDGSARLLKTQVQVTADFDTEASSVDNGLQGSAATVSSSSVASPSVITTAAAHGFLTGDTVLIAGHSGSTPDINGSHTVTVTASTTFTIPVNVTVGGTGGTAQRASTRNGSRSYFFLPDSANHPFALGGHTALDLDTRDSVDDATYATLAAAASLTARGSEVVSSTGAVDRYVACGGDFTGAGSPTASPVIAVNRNEYNGA